MNRGHKRSRPVSHEAESRPGASYNQSHFDYDVDNLIVIGTSLLHGIVTAFTNMFVNGDLDVTGNTSTTTLNVSGPATFDNGVTITGELETEEITSSGIITGQGLNITAGTCLLTTTSTSGMLTATNGLTVPGTSTLAIVNASGLLSANGGFTVNGNSALGATSTSGLLTANNGLTVPGTSALGIVNVTGLTSANGGLTVVGIANMATTNHSALGTFSSGLTVSSGLMSVQAITANGLIRAAANLQVDGTATMAFANFSEIITGAQGCDFAGSCVLDLVIMNEANIVGIGGLTVSTGDSTFGVVVCQDNVFMDAALTVAGASAFNTATHTGLISGSAGLTISAGTTSLVAATHSGLISGSAGLTISAGTTSLVAATHSGLISGSAGLTISAGTTSLVAATHSGLISGSAGLTISAGTTSLGITDCSGLLSANNAFYATSGFETHGGGDIYDGLAVYGGFTVSTGTSYLGTTNVSGLITGSAGLTISAGTTSLGTTTTGTFTSTGTATMATVTTSGTFTAGGNNMLFTGSSAGNVRQFTIGRAVAADSYISNIDFKQNTTYSTYVSRIQRAAGDNGIFLLANRGTGAFQFDVDTGSRFVFRINSTNRLNIDDTSAIFDTVIDAQSGIENTDTGLIECKDPLDISASIGYVKIRTPVRGRVKLSDGGTGTLAIGRATANRPSNKWIQDTSNGSISNMTLITSDTNGFKGALKIDVPGVYMFIFQGHRADIIANGYAMEIASSDTGAPTITKIVFCEVDPDVLIVGFRTFSATWNCADDNLVYMAETAAGGNVLFNQLSGTTSRPDATLSCELLYAT